MDAGLGSAGGIGSEEQNFSLVLIKIQEIQCHPCFDISEAVEESLDRTRTSVLWWEVNPIVICVKIKRDVVFLKNSSKWKQIQRE